MVAAPVLRVLRRLSISEQGQFSHAQVSPSLSGRSVDEQCRVSAIRPLEVEGFPLVQLRFVHSFWTISGTDVAEAAFLWAGYSPRGFVG